MWKSQKAAYGVFKGFDDRLEISRAGKKSHPDVGKYLEAKQDGHWYRAQVLAVKDGKHEVAYLGFGEKEWVKNDRLREYHPKQFKEGTHVLAKNDDDKWLPAVVKRPISGAPRPFR